MSRRTSTFVSVLCLLGACLLGCGEMSSRLPEHALLSELDEGSEALLCRFTTDQLEDVDWSCTGLDAPRELTAHEACVDDPPWEAFSDVGSWERCVRARQLDPCDADADCTP